MDHGSVSATPSGLPPPPASPAARSYTSPGLRTLPFAAEACSAPGVCPTTSRQQAELLNLAVDDAELIEKLEQDHAHDAPFLALEFDSQGHSVEPNGATCSNLENGTPFAARTAINLNRPRAASVLTHKRLFSSVAGGQPIVHQPITSSTPTSTIADQLANAARAPDQAVFHPQQHTAYSFTAPQAPHFNQQQPTQQAQQQQQQPPHHSRTPSSASAARPFPAFSLPTLSQLPQAFTAFESLLPTRATFEEASRLTPSSLLEIAKKNIPNPATIASVLTPLAGGAAGGSGSGGHDGRATSFSAKGSTCSQRKPTKHAILSEILRVDHAGEYGAQRIYDGQLAVLGAKEAFFGRPTSTSNRAATGPVTSSAGTPPKSNSPQSAVNVIRHMRDQEIEHLRTLQRLLPEHGVRPTLLLPLWDVIGFGLGAASALLGERSAMACTVAVEEVITAHYNDQLRALGQAGFEDQQDLKRVIRKHRDDEEEHRDIAIEHEAKQAPAYQLITQAVTAGCHAAIAITKRV